MIRPTALLIAIGAAALPLSILLVWLRDDLWIAVVALVAAVFVLAVLDAQISMLKFAMSVEPDPPGHFYIGEQNVLPVALNGGRYARDLSVEIVLDADPAIATVEPLAVTFDESGQARAIIPIDVHRRGSVAMDALWIRWRSGLGLNTHLLRVPLGLKVPSLPNVAAVRRAAVQYQRRGSIFGTKTQQQQGDGSDFDALRDYAPGMNLRAIDWKHSAKLRHLVAKEFRVEQNHHIVIALDTGYLMREPLKGVVKLDRAINASLILAYQALAEGDRVGLFAFDSEVRLYQTPVSGARAFPAIQMALSGLDYSLEETNFTLGLSALMAQLHRRALIVILTDYVDTITAELMLENIERLSKRHLVMFVALKDQATAGIANAVPSDIDAAAQAIAAMDIMRERRIVLDRLTRLGIAAFEADPERLDSALVSRYLKIKRREMI